VSGIGCNTCQTPSTSQSPLRVYPTSDLQAWEMKCFPASIGIGRHGRFQKADIMAMFFSGADRSREPHGSRNR